MGAKARIPVVSRQQKEIESLIGVLHVLDHVVKHRPPVSKDKELRHKTLVAQYVEARDKFTARRDELIQIVRRGEYYQLPSALKTMDEAQVFLSDVTDGATL